MSTLVLRKPDITLAQAVKAAGLAGSGGQAKLLVRDGQVFVNGALEQHPGRRLKAGDRFKLGDSLEWLVVEAS